MVVVEMRQTMSVASAVAATGADATKGLVTNLEVAAAGSSSCSCKNKNPVDFAGANESQKSMDAENRPINQRLSPADSFVADVAKSFRRHRRAY